MHLAARSNALDDLLAKVAALRKMQGPRLVCLLREVLIANVDAVTRRSLEEAKLFEVYIAPLDRAGVAQRLGQEPD